MSILLIAITILCALLSTILAQALLPLLTERIPGDLGIGLLFLTFALLYAAAVNLYNVLRRKDTGFRFGMHQKQVLLVTAVCMALCFGMGMGLEAVYTHVSPEALRPTQDTVLLWDRSTSMTTTDPDQASDQALIYFVQDVAPDNNVAVLRYADDAAVLLPASAGGSKSATMLQAAIDAERKAEGQTNFRKALALAEDFAADMQRGRQLDLVLISDGYATDMSEHSYVDAIAPFQKNGVRIFTIGTENVNTALMQAIAKDTGGNFIHIADFNTLGSALTTIAAGKVEDTLLTARTDVRRQTQRLMLERIVFLWILGFGIGCCTIMLYETERVRAQLLRAAIGSLAAGIAAELLLQSGDNEAFAQACYLTLVMLTSCIKARGIPNHAAANGAGAAEYKKGQNSADELRKQGERYLQGLRIRGKDEN